jgi:hypothetical protein
MELLIHYHLLYNFNADDTNFWHDVTQPRSSHSQWTWMNGTNNLYAISNFDWNNSSLRRKCIILLLCPFTAVRPFSCAWANKGASFSCTDNCAGKLSSITLLIALHLNCIWLYYMISKIIFKYKNIAFFNISFYGKEFNIYKIWKF